ncbi:hypothetical protein RHSIM_Rhsim11G0173800 [Rhododendron simsii]|uniref:BZIP domain-containing protein n=1 Tax=Rhododendron simsii TaxID=118357 RepID=A0A834LAY1_RHOSS|nr:hypothetical protein RHSIM_Rhsim11G0173800 [Rhododendron simsii]
METEGVGSPAKPPKLMANGEDAKPVKSSKRNISTEERTLAPQPDWLALMQMQGLAFRLPKAEGKVSYRAEPMRECTGSLGGVGFMGERSGESAKTTGSSRIDCDRGLGIYFVPFADSILKWLLNSGIASTSHDSDKAKHEECHVMKKRNFDQMLADEANVDYENTVSANYGGAKHQVLLQGDKLLYMPASKGDRGISSKGSSPASKFMMKNHNKPSGASEPVASAKMVAHEKVMSAQQIQDVPKLLDERRNLQNKEAARRLRDRREEELERMDEANAFSALKAKDPYRCLQSVREDNNGCNQESSSDHKSSLTDPSTPDT